MVADAEIAVREAAAAGALAGQRALVTGGGTGVGLAVARRLADEGASVLVTGRRRSVLDEAVRADERLEARACDATDRDAMRDAAEGCDIVVANAGAAVSRPFERMEAADLRHMLDANLVSVFETFQAALPTMRERGEGRLIAVASTAGLKGYPYVAGYCAAKHAVVGLVRALALELARTGVTCNAVCPGYTDTPMLARTLDNIAGKTGRTRDEAAAPLLAHNPQGRFVRPDEVADAVAWLCGASAVTGQAVSVSGGEVM